MGCGDSHDGEAAPEPFQFIVMSDVHVRLPGNPDDGFFANQRNLDNLQYAVNRINTWYPAVDFIAVTGDLVGCLFSDNPDDYLIGIPNPAEEFMQIMDGLVRPYYVAFGNHDYLKGFDPVLGEGIGTDDITLMEAVWEKVLGIAPYYAFIHKGVHMIFLNSNRGPQKDRICAGSRTEPFCTGSFDTEQLLWLETCLRNDAPAVIFCHHPLQTDSANIFWAFFSSYRIDPEDLFYDILSAHRDKILSVFVGHGHIWQSDTLYETISVHETGSVGDMLGSGDHFSIVTIDPDARRVTVTRNK